MHSTRMTPRQNQLGRVESLSSSVKGGARDGSWEVSTPKFPGVSKVFLMVFNGC